MHILASVALLLGLFLSMGDLSRVLFPEDHPLPVLVSLAWARTCHQRPERSFELGGHPLPACTRCVGLHASTVLGGLLLLLPCASLLRSLGARRLILVGLLPMALDVALGISLPDWDLPWLRFATGLWAGTALLLAARRGVAGD